MLRARDQLLRLAGGDARGGPRDRDRAASSPALDPEAEERVLLEATLAAFPDRVARRREPGKPALVFARGGAGELAATSVVRGAEFLVAVDADDRRERGVPRPARRRDRSRLAARPLPGAGGGARGDGLPGGDRPRGAALLAALRRADARRQPRPAPPDDETAEVLFRAVRDLGPGAVVDAEEVARWRHRVAFAASLEPGLPALDDAALHDALRAACAGRRSLAELREAGVLAGWLARLTPAQRAAVERLAPERVALPGGRRVAVQYEPGKPPWIASRLQDFFGMSEGPRAGDGRVPLVLHLLAPNQRPVQVTTDLAGFWERHYPALRRELMRRYPRHAWPDDPRTASPPASGTKRGRNAH